MLKNFLDKSAETEISEIFSSLQGEGPYFGVKQIFARFGRCNMHCGYCDELEKMKEEAFRVYTLDETLEKISALEAQSGPHHSVSLTGGEPLFYAPFLKNLLPKLKEKGYLVYLETNGTLPRELSSVIRWCDIIAMDLKPPSSTGDRNFWAEHEAFLKTAIQKEVFIKVVVTPDTRADEIEACVKLVSGINPKIPFILQPQSDPIGITPPLVRCDPENGSAIFNGRTSGGVNAEALRLIETQFFATARASLFDVRVIPQMHKIWGVR